MQTRHSVGRAVIVAAVALTCGVAHAQEAPSYQPTGQVPAASNSDPTGNLATPALQAAAFAQAAASMQQLLYLQSLTLAYASAAQASAAQAAQTAQTAQASA